MQEIVPHIYIENSYPGVTLGAINWPHGLILIDAPFRPEDARSWRSALLNLSGGVDRLLINLDAHLDRTLGVRAMDCTVVGHEKMGDVYRNRPVTFKAQPGESGGEWELYSSLGSVRWAPPELTFTQELAIHWNGSPVVLQHRPGPTPSSIWVELPEQQTVFVGDAVVPANQAPFLASADLGEWTQLLNRLLSPEYQDWMLVSGRGGLVTTDDVRRLLRFLEKVGSQVESLAENGSVAADTARLVPGLISGIQSPSELAALYQNRLRYGLQQYYARRYRPSDVQEGNE